MSSSSKIRIHVVEHDSPGYWEALVLRNAILREPLGLDFSDAEVAAEAEQVHIAAFEKRSVVGTLCLKGDGDGLVQMRQLAVTPRRRGQGIGRDLVKFAEALVWAECGTELFLHAREPVIGFYEALGYQREGDLFLEVGIPHLKLSKSMPEEDRPIPLGD